MLTIVSPVYNEAANAPALLNAIETNIRVPKEVLFVYDREEDNTLPVLRARQPKSPFPIRLVRNTSTGVVNAIRTGFETATGDAVVVVMADLSDDLNDVNEMFRLVTEEGVDVVCGSRYMKGGQQRGGPPFKQFLSRMAGLTLHLITGLPTVDATNSFKMYRTSKLHSLTLESTGGFEIGLEVVTKGFVRGWKIAEVPTVWTDRVAGKSRFKIWGWMGHYLHWYFYAIRGRFGLLKDLQHA